MSDRVEAEDAIQAVVIADSFNYRFLPVTVEQPRALLPLVNRPLIDYTVEFLAVAGVQEIFVYCCTHAEAVRAHLEASRWMKPASPVKLRTIISEACPSVGDALRDIDAQSLIRTDFVLVSGDLVANMQLQEVVQKHRELKKRDKMLVMTCVYKKAQPKHRTRSIEDDILICTNAADGQLLHCEKPRNQRRVNIPLSLLDDHREIEVRYDLLDCHISICSPSVPQLFSDNFDYQTRHHFIRGILMNEDILGNHIYTHVITDQYAARVCNFSTYDAISKDVIHRWVYPLVPDNTDEACSYGRRNIYLNTDVSLAFGCELHEDVVIGRNTSIGVSTHITQSSIGHNCRIGDNVVIEGAYVWDNCVIDRGSRVYRSILCDGVYVKSNVMVEPGCVLSYGVIVGPDFTVKTGSRITTSRDTGVPGTGKGDWGEEAEEVAKVMHKSLTEDSDPAEVGGEGHGFLWKPPTEEDEESDQFVVEEWPANEAESSGGETSSESSRNSTPGPAQPSHQFLEGADLDNLLFYNEIIDLIRSGLAEKVNTDNTILMINAAKHAYNIPIGEVPLAVVRAILEGPRRSTGATASGASTGSTQSSDTMSYIKSAVIFFTSLLRHYIKDLALQLGVVETLVDCAEKQPAILSNLARLVLLFYNQDVVEESVILSWHQSYCSAGDSPKKLEVLGAVKPVVEWLQTASEESSSEEEGE